MQALQGQIEFLSSYGDELLHGAWLTVVLSIRAMLLGLVAAVLLAVARFIGPPFVKWLVAAYVEIIRNTPFLVQIFLVYFGLPVLGLRLTPGNAALVAMVINVAAYAAEIIRAGLESIPKGQIEAGYALGLSTVQNIRYVIFKPAMRAIYPALTSQFVLLMLQSSVVSVISASELTSTALRLQSITFQTFNIFVIVTIMYILITVIFYGIFNTVDRIVFSYPDRR